MSSDNEAGLPDLRGIADREVLITGGTGSFGNALVQRLLRTHRGGIRIFSRDELKQELMRQRYADKRLKFFLGDVRDEQSVRRAVDGVDLVFHAAALKQVPSCEFFPEQAVQTNVLGSSHVIRAAVEGGVEKVVCLSTDKAVYPVNAMGMSKALMEKTAMSVAREQGAEDTVVSCVRYGNVMCSRGSVIPLFSHQIEEGLPITVTMPEMTRFMLPLSEAIELVLFAFAHATSGDLFVRKAPACTIGELSAALQHIYGREVEQQIIGRRHGEKVFETLLTAEEMQRAEDMGDYYRVRLDDRDLNYALYVSRGTRPRHRRGTTTRTTRSNWGSRGPSRSCSAFPRSPSGWRPGGLGEETADGWHQGGDHRDHRLRRTASARSPAGRRL